MNKVGKWDGQRWCGLPGTLNTNAGSIATLAIFRDSLYMCGGFTTIDGDSIRQVAKWIGGDAVENCSEPLGMDEPEGSMALRLFPNPAYDQVTFTTGQPMGVTIYDALSRIVWSGNISGHTTIDASSWAAGSYTVRHEYGAIKLLLAH
ncbi:MAG: T9SS type A sorting domain-containing protein [Flavobacteriales bacterium]|nr:T9SS type A sorting domain-containing protein [Flavobacteriales bacterium]